MRWGVSWFVYFNNNCVRLAGQRFALLEMKVVLAFVLRRFKIEATQTFDELHLMGQLITRPKDGMIVKLTGRS